jgi:opacity protein-like surface antigen
MKFASLIFSLFFCEWCIRFETGPKLNSKTVYFKRNLMSAGITSIEIVIALLLPARNWMKLVNVSTGINVYFTSCMKRWFLYAVLGIALSTPKLYAQDRRYSLSAAFGPSFPVGKFEQAGTDLPSKQSAAEPGISATIGLNYQLNHSRFGLSLTAGWQQYRVDGEAIAKTVTRTSPDEQVYASSYSWHIWKLLLGPSYQIPVGKDGKLNFQFGVSGGMMRTTLPGSGEQLTYTNSAASYFNNPQTKLASFCYQANAGLDLRVTNSLSLTGNLLFFHADPSNMVYNSTGPTDIYLYTGPGPTGTVAKAKISYPISTIDFMVGISFRF